MENKTFDKDEIELFDYLSGEPLLKLNEFADKIKGKGKRIYMKNYITFLFTSLEFYKKGELDAFIYTEHLTENMVNTEMQETLKLINEHFNKSPPKHSQD